MRIIKITILLLVIFTNLFAAGETTKSGTAAAQFLKIGAGARAQAMGGSAAALSGDATALFWNPAGIADIHRVSWVGTHTRWFADITHQFTGLVLPVGRNSVLGISATLLNMDEEEITTIESPGGTELFWDAADLSFGISFATQLTDRFSIGLTGKYVHQKIFNETASTLAIDLGTLLKTSFKGLTIGMSLSNFGGDLKLSGRDLIRAYDPNPANSRNDDVDVRLHTQPWPLPVNFRVGIAMNLFGKPGESFMVADHHALLLAIDANHPNDAAENLKIGLEYRLNNLLALRTGYKFNEDLVKFSFGAGLQFPLRQSVVSVDFATASYGELDYVNFLAFGFQF